MRVFFLCVCVRAFEWEWCRLPRFLCLVAYQVPVCLLSSVAGLSPFFCCFIYLLVERSSLYFYSLSLSLLVSLSFFFLFFSLDVLLFFVSSPLLICVIVYRFLSPFVYWFLPLRLSLPSLFVIFFSLSCPFRLFHSFTLCIFTFPLSLFLNRLRSLVCWILHCFLYFVLVIFISLHLFFPYSYPSFFDCSVFSIFLCHLLSFLPFSFRMLSFSPRHHLLSSCLLHLVPFP